MKSTKKPNIKTVFRFVNKLQKKKKKSLNFLNTDFKKLEKSCKKENY